MSIIVWIVIGGLAGWIASLIMKTDGGFLKNIVTGVVGALIGGFLMDFLGQAGFTGFNVWSFVVALVGSIVLLALINLITGKKS
ncbi:GlsB/YeaQ/YmgE family stress response membrane protein [Paraeggerthella hongkongensis]|uniref:GlsB/YeaQ/YmgE family stress response membrane protein n=1 Tax=Paraeggerthella hongkongensis TaxID=230658 RepID=A0A3N0BJ47_9ACTN|nr:GlsB/YeaQ/YmgE family stress response membrane protein [Paraeggerthella hongkongensis]RNL48302.1 GlsB/YeaQ/YmgE family stress response membrane protein [Paraeggerthella hongkongensis]